MSVEFAKGIHLYSDQEFITKTIGLIKSLQLNKPLDLIHISKNGHILSKKRALNSYQPSIPQNLIIFIQVLHISQTYALLKVFI